MQLGVFLPIANNGWMISTNAPQFLPTFDLNKSIVQSAERFGFDFALSMIKLRGFGGQTRFWDFSLESLTLMAGLASVTERIELIGSVPVLAIPPAITARMATTIDSISHGRCGINIVSGWQKAEYDQMGLWPGASHYERRYAYCAEYVSILRELWTTGRSDFRGEFFEMNDCRMEPMPQASIPIVGAGQSDAGTAFAAECCDYNFCSTSGVNAPQSVAPKVAKLVAAAEAIGSPCKALVLTMVVAAATDAEAEARWQSYRDGADVDAMEFRETQSSLDPNKDVNATAARWRRSQAEHPNTGQGIMIGSYERVAGLLDELAEIEGIAGIMLSFDDFPNGMEAFGTEIQPRMKSRASIVGAA
ncbi:pyrimidine utilization protein A [Acuticoccus mangrovi]|uniref:Pyrimidine utilization protein A n=1 Tax=Acuticoccus mangrovi TaxID=2796142 RepID=A0A934MCR5_9HYPH|nr:pyrimidine utilization protein A [Acuticoccus mangrovi]